MMYKLVDVLACPICKSFPLEISIFDESSNQSYDKHTAKEPLCELYCSFLKLKITKNNKFPCARCVNYDIESALLKCSSCKRYYPVINGIPRMLPDKLRNKKEDKIFMKKFKANLHPNSK